jgi:parvulin-like peptidyl-prolyl isomerase
VATVDGQAIRALDLRQEVRRVSGPPQAGDTSRRAVAAAILEQRVDEQVLLAAALAAGVEVSDRDVDEALANTRTGYRRRDFNSALHAQVLTPEALRQSTARRLAVERFLRDRLQGLPPVSEEDVARYHQEHREAFRVPLRVRARQILVMTAEEAALIQERLRRGADFDRLARAHSVAPERERGGDLGFFTRGVMPEVFDRVCFPLAVNQVSDVVQSQYGHHIFQVTERQVEQERALETVAPEIRAKIAEERREVAEQALLRDLRARAVVVRDPAALDWAAEVEAVARVDGGNG